MTYQEWREKFCPSRNPHRGHAQLLNSLLGTGGRDRELVDRHWKKHSEDCIWSVRRVSDRMVIVPGLWVGRGTVGYLITGFPYEELTDLEVDVSCEMAEVVA